ncbi:MAG: hypothetical protein LQ344_006025 [Seirophora lacunosa]|nr:MAG: hypothetical protein LQ344_006025 [Seirophora lacunosa]
MSLKHSKMSALPMFVVHDEYVPMRLPAIFRAKKNVLLCLALLAIVYLSGASRLLYVPSLLGTQRPCNFIDVPTTREPSPQLLEQWVQLQELFEAHPPNLAMERIDFQGGQTAKLTTQLLADYFDMTPLEAESMREEHASVVQGLPDYPQRVFAGRGIAIIAGGRYSEFAATTLGMIRLTGSRLPVEMWMRDRGDEKAGWCDDLLTQGAACRFVSDYMADMSAFSHHYQLKAPVIMFSAFAHVLYLDSDSIPVVNPDPVFDAPVYVNTGAVLWPDYWGASESPFTPFITGRGSAKATAVPAIQTVDAGQMLWNKEKHWKVLFLPHGFCHVVLAHIAQALCLSAYYNYFGPDYFYTLLTQGGPGWGDKDTFPTAFRALNANWTLVPHRLQTQRYDDGTGKGMGTGMAMMQADPAHSEGFQPLFLHSNFVKFRVRRLMCAECMEDASALSAQDRSEGKSVVFKGHIMDRGSAIRNQMLHGKRVFATKTGDGLNDMGKLDTEKDIWRVMESVACVGAFSEEKICARTRRHLETTFGVESRWDGRPEGMCQ